MIDNFQRNIKKINTKHKEEFRINKNKLEVELQWSHICILSIIKITLNEKISKEASKEARNQAERQAGRPGKQASK